MKKLLLTLALCGAAAAGAQAQIVNPGMESWHNYIAGFPPKALETADNWYGADSLMAVYSVVLGSSANQQLFKSTDAHSGSFAAKVMTRSQGMLGEVPGVIMNARPNFDLTDTFMSFTGGTPVSGWVDSVYAWVKYAHNGEFPEDDTAQMTAMAFKSGAGAGSTDSMVGTGTFMIVPTAAYTQVGLKMDYTATLQPDKIIIIFSSSPFSLQNAFGTTALDSSTLYVDDVSMVMGTLGVPAVFLATDEVRVFPNPAHEVLNIATSARHGTLELEVYNTTGQRVAMQQFEAQLQLNTTTMAAGNYFYQIRNSGGQVVRQGRFQVAR